MKSLYIEDAEIREIARQVIAVRPEVAHVQLDDVLFLRDVKGGPRGVGAHCYSFAAHPINHFTDHRFCIVVYEKNTFYMSAPQMALLIFHELMHIPRLGDKLIDHTVKDFAKILGLGGVYWAAPGEDVPDILEGYCD